MSAETADFCGSDSGWVSWRFFRFSPVRGYSDKVMPSIGPDPAIHPAFLLQKIKHLSTPPNLMPLWGSPNAWETPQRRHVVATLNFDCSVASIDALTDPWNMCRISRILEGTVDGWNPAPVEVGSLSHYLQGFIHPRSLFGISTINSMDHNDMFSDISY